MYKLSWRLDGEQGFKYETYKSLGELNNRFTVLMGSLTSQYLKFEIIVAYGSYKVMVSSLTPSKSFQGGYIEVAQNMVLLSFWIFIFLLITALSMYSLLTGNY